MRYNSWAIRRIENGGEYEATFTPDDFEGWFLAGADRSTRFTGLDQRQLYENCLYLAEAEGRRITQSSSELKRSIRQWAQDWNKELGDA